jgi:iron complex outermembrane receptor protein
MKIRYLGPVVAIAAAMSNSALAAEKPVDFRIPAGPLANALADFPRQAGLGLLFDPVLTQGMRTPGLLTKVGPTEGLARLLSGSGLSYRRLASGGYVVVASDRRTTMLTPPSSADVTTVPELLVVGRRTLNTDIRRSPDDIQPYQIAAGAEIRIAQATSVEDFLRSRSPSNSELMAPNQAPVLNQGANGSAINLGGYGTSQTLVLVDGRRLAGIYVFGNFLQPDLNAISPAAIDRIETLTSTAGGIYGPGAVGGVVNVILKRDFDGVDLAATTGVSDRGDGRRWRIDGSAGGTIGGATRVMLAVSHASDDGLRVGDRDYIYRSRLTRSSNNASPAPISSPSINILGFRPLAVVGGPKLLNTKTSLPPGEGVPASGIDALLANAGTYDQRLSLDGAGTLQSAIASTLTTSAVLSVRRGVGPRIELFADAIFLDNRGSAAGPLFRDDYVTLLVGQNGNPFTGPVTATFPTEGRYGRASTAIQSRRAAIGAIARLPFDWSTDLDVSVGSTRTKATPFAPAISADFLQQTGVDLFAGAAALQAALDAYVPPGTAAEVHRNTMTDANLRIAGPVFYTGAGATTLTLLAETRREHTPAASALDPALSLDSPYNLSVGQSEGVWSGYAELRAPLVAIDGSSSPLRGFEVQLAGRLDQFDVKVPARKLSAGGLDGVEATRAHMSVSAYVVGFKVSPVRGLLVRASFATGYLPPSPSQLIPFTTATSFSPIPDPKRPGDTLGSQGSYLTQAQGSPTLRPEKARTSSLGAILTPGWLPGLRLSVDYTRISKSGEIGLPASTSQSEIFKLEDQFPGIVKRGPLSSADMAAGYVVGPVTFLDQSLRNLGHSTTQITEFHGEYAREADAGSFTIYGHAAWQPTFRRTTTPLAATDQLAGHLDGPLRLRGNAGLAWTGSAWAAGVNVQFYSHYSIIYGANDGQSLQLSRGIFGTVKYQGAETIPSQTYVDATLGYTVSRRSEPILVRVGVRNVLGSRPPAVSIPLQPSVYGFTSEQGIGYSPYGDPRGRRFELSAARRF